MAGKNNIYVIHLFQFDEQVSCRDAVLFGSLAKSITASQTETNCPPSLEFAVRHVTCQPTKSFNNFLFVFFQLIATI